MDVLCWDSNPRFRQEGTDGSSGPRSSLVEGEEGSYRPIIKKLGNCLNCFGVS